MAGTATTRLRVLLEITVVGALVAAGLARDHARGGVEAIFIGLVLGLLGPTYRRWLALRGQLPGPPRASFLLEVVATCGPILEYPTPWWSQASVLSANAILVIEALRPDRGMRTTSLDAAVLLIVALPASVATVRLASGQPLAWLSIALLVGLWGESFWPLGGMPSGRMSAVGSAFAIVGMAATYDSHRLLWVDGFAVHALVLGCALPLIFDRAAPEPRPALRRVLGIASSVAVGGSVLLLLAAPLVSGPLFRVPVEASGVASRKGHGVLAYFPRLRVLYTVEDPVLVEDSVPLPFPDTAPADIAALGSGRYRFPEKFAVEWSARDNSDPLGNGRLYTLEGRTPVPFTPWAGALIVLAIGLCRAAWRAGVSALRTPSSGLRAALVGALLGSLLPGLAHGWDRIGANPDSGTYVTHASGRPPLYSWWIDIFDRSSAERSAAALDTSGVLRADPENRFLNVVRAQKVLTVLALAVLVWALSRIINVWLLAIMTYWGVLADLCANGAGAISTNVSNLLSEGVNHALVFLLLASVLAYLARPGWVRGVLVAAVLVLLNLNRPANAILCVVLPFLWIFDVPSAGWRKATLRVAGIVLVFALPLALVAAANERKTGHARLHSFTGGTTICMAIQVSTPDDVAAFEDRPELQKLVKACVVDNAAMIASPASYDVTTAGACLGKNIYENALPSFVRTVAVPAHEDLSFYMNECFLEVSKRILLRHKLAYARLVLINFSAFWDWRLDGLSILVAAAAIVVYRRERAWPFLYLAFLVLLPLISIVPSCLVAFPIDRYVSQFGFIRPLAVPIFLSAVATHRSSRTGSS